MSIPPRDRQKPHSIIHLCTQMLVVLVRWKGLEEQGEEDPRDQVLPVLLLVAHLVRILEKQDPDKEEGQDSSVQRIYLLPVCPNSDFYFRISERGCDRENSHTHRMYASRLKDSYCLTF